MTLGNERKTLLKQEINGDNNQVAGRDIINEYKSYQPDISRTEFIPCVTCLKPISKKATKCPECGHDFHNEYLLKQHEAQIKSKNLGDMLVTLGAALLIVSSLFSQATRFSWLESVVIVSFSAFFLWCLGLVVVAYLKDWWEERKYTK